MGFEEKLRAFEAKWQKKWQDAEVFRPEPDDRDKFFITVAYPYPSGGMHIGHVGTYTLPDVFARFQRLQGKNVLFPMAWHVTGTPIIGAVNRLKNREEKQLDVLTNTYNVPEDDLEDLETPMGYANYFIDSYRENMQNLGFSVDWRRQFTTNDERYNRFIEWQYRTLKDQGLVKKGKHPTKYCLSDQNPVTTHDLLEGEDADQQEYTLVKFEQDSTVVPMATLRPETVYGVTHALVDPEGNYVKAKVDGEEWIVSDAAVDKLEHQGHDLVVQEEFRGEELVGDRVTNPVTGREVLILPASFVDTGAATGIVMSVPGHAPYDWISLRELQEDDEKLERYGLNPQQVKDITPISIIDVDGFGDHPAKDIVEEMNITSQEQQDKLDKATDKVYKKEFHSGTLKDGCQEFAGQSVSEVKDRLVELYEDQGRFGSMWDFSEPVVCRCGGKVIVAETDTWFLEYGDKAWKDQAYKVLDQLRTIPGSTREDYNHTINWLESWPCIRNYGLGTQLPFDEEFVVEPLSDSTIYMAFYTIAHRIQDIKPSRLTDEFFDYVFHGKGPVEDVADTTGIPEEKLKEVRESFEYWYPLDWRTSGNDLVQNHLTFFMFHHAALFDETHWPKGIATWGMGLLEGKKMSSSKGHVVLPDEAIKNYGADTVRFFMFASREPWQDFDWRQDEVENYRKQLENFYSRTLDFHDTGEKRDPNRIDRYVLSRLNSIIQEAEERMEDFETRKASLKSFFELNNVIRWYSKRTNRFNQDIINQVLDAQIRMMAPFIPHLCEELWEETGHDGFVSTAEWPEVDEETIDPAIEYSEELVRTTIEDVKEIRELVDEFETVTIVIGADWKRDAVKIIKQRFDEHGEIDIGATMGELTSRDDLKQHGQQLSGMVQEFAQDPGELPDLILETGEERELFEEAREFIANKFNAQIEIVAEDESGHDKADRAMPGKPAIILE